MRMGADRSPAASGGDGGAKAGGNERTVGAFVAQVGLHLKRLELAGGVTPFSGSESSGLRLKPRRFLPLPLIPISFGSNRTLQVA